MDPAKRLGRKVVRPVYRSNFTFAHMLDPETRFDPETGETFDKNGKKLGPSFDLVEVDPDDN